MLARSAVSSLLKLGVLEDHLVVLGVLRLIREVFSQLLRRLQLRKWLVQVSIISVKEQVQPGDVIIDLVKVLHRADFLLLLSQEIGVEEYLSLEESLSVSFKEGFLIVREPVSSYRHLIALEVRLGLKKDQQPLLIIFEGFKMRVFAILSHLELLVLQCLFFILFILHLEVSKDSNSRPQLMWRHIS